MISPLFLWIRTNRLLACFIGAGALLFALYAAWMVAVHLGETREAQRQEAARAAAIVGALEMDAAAKEVAAAQRRADDAAVSAQTKELNDAIATLPDGVPSPRRLALACARLRAQGDDLSDVPECR